MKRIEQACHHKRWTLVGRHALDASLSIVYFTLKRKHEIVRRGFYITYLIISEANYMIEQSQQSSVETSILSITPAASEKVRELLKQENDPSLGLRIFVAGGGCSGPQYGLTLDVPQAGDTIISQDDHSVLGDET